MVSVQSCPELQPSSSSGQYEGLTAKSKGELCVGSVDSDVVAGRGCPSLSSYNAL